MKMLTIQLTAADAVAIASLAAATNGRDAGAEVLGQIRVKVSGSGEIMAIATNRFMLATYATTAAGVSCACNECALGSERPGMEFGITPAAAKFITANVKRGNKWNTPDNVELIANVDTGELSVRHGAAVYGDTWPLGKFPAIESLITDWTPAATAMPVKLRQAFVVTLAKLMNGFEKVDYWTYELGAATMNRTDRPGPVKATAGQFTALIMPNLL